MYLFKT